jgi:hypothetical protein
VEEGSEMTIALGAKPIHEEQRRHYEALMWESLVEGKRMGVLIDVIEFNNYEEIPVQIFDAIKDAPVRTEIVECWLCGDKPQENCVFCKGSGKELKSFSRDSNYRKYRPATAADIAGSTDA